MIPIGLIISLLIVFIIFLKMIVIMNLLISPFFLSSFSFSLSSPLLPLTLSYNSPIIPLNHYLQIHYSSITLRNFDTKITRPGGTINVINYGTNFNSNEFGNYNMNNINNKYGTIRRYK